MHDLYFTGGTSSFAHCFKRQFPTHESSDGELLHEVPIPMVALVATAVIDLTNEDSSSDDEEL